MGEEKAECRWCKRELRGQPYYRGGTAYLPEGGRAKVCHYGGFVCSESCDYKACLDLEQTMPGHVGQQSLSGDVLRNLRSKWED